MAADILVHRIELLGLKVTLAKTEAIVFGGRGREWRLPAGAHFSIGGETVQVWAQIKYLGLVVDRK